MADRSIDLLKPEEIAPAEKKRAFFLKMSVITLIVFYCLIVVSIFSFWLVVHRESQVVSERISQKKARLNELKETETLQFVLKQRLTSLTRVVETERLEPKYWLDYLDSLVPEGVALESVTWSLGGEVSLSGMAGNALVLSGFLDNLKEAADRQKVASSILSSATRQEDGVYDFTMEVIIKELPE